MLTRHFSTLDQDLASQYSMQRCTKVFSLNLGCRSKGVEVVPGRVQFCVSLRYDFEDDPKLSALIKLREIEAGKLSA